MGWLENVIVEDKELENERFEVTDKNSLYFLGPRLTLRNCTIVLNVSARRLHVLGVRFIDCAFEVKQELKNHQAWLRASLQGCRFKGRFLGCDFGHWPEYGSEPEFQQGSVADCDFSEARLDACRFMDCDPATLRFPKWPCFTFLDPISRASELLKAEWPDLFRRVIVDQFRTQPARTKAVTYHAPSIAKRLETTPEALRAVIEKFDCIVS
jgi:hypothetical protein